MKVLDIVLPNDLINIKRFGVYKISTRHDKDKCYIGATGISFYDRWYRHLYGLKNKSHENFKLQEVVDKYGLDSLVFEIIEVLCTKKNLYEREQYWIDKYNSYQNGYNCQPNAKDSTGKVKREESISMFYKEVSQYTLDGEFIHTYKSMKCAAKDTKTDYVTLTNACSGKCRTANNYQWRYGNSIEKIAPIRVKGAKKIGKYDLYGNLLEVFLSIKEASKSVNLAPNTISAAIKRGFCSKGFLWKKL